MKIPEGWKLVPVDPTEEMLKAANMMSLSTEVLLDDTRFACERALWQAALEHAPEPPPFEMSRLDTVVANLDEALNGKPACSRAKSDMTPCVVKDGEVARSEDGKCVGCGRVYCS